MICSMTGYGRAEYNFADHKTLLEIRSLNSKQLDLTLKLTPFFRLREQDIRSLLAAALFRGKVDVSLTTIPLDSQTPQDRPAASFAAINKDAFRFYYNQLRDLQTQLGAPQESLFAAVLRLPDVMQTAAEASINDD